MLGRLLVVAALAAHSTGVLGAATPAFVRCATDEPPAALVEEAKALAKALPVPQAELASQAPIQVDTHFHIVDSSAGLAFNNTREMADLQIEVINQAYADSNIVFNLVGTDSTVNAAWARGSDQLAMKRKLRIGSYNDLNLYFLSDLGGGLLGQCTFPTNSASALTEDGCIVLKGSMAGGNVPNYSKGLTAVHEIGHWLGLFHVFQGQSCSGAGDSVADTPLQSSPTQGCPATKDSCPNAPGNDAIENYMDYSYDSCMNKFSAGQSTRIAQFWQTYRAGK
ncbi:MAG: hypothetical protein M1832_001555 [Thelocarpon impressellum]|nr:MAG: hypothetical protein M1832_001555 [Thelocarpon impressellum]